MDKTHCVVVADRAGTSFIYAECCSEEEMDLQATKALLEYPWPKYVVSGALTEPDE